MLMYMLMQSSQACVQAVTQPLKPLPSTTVWRVVAVGTRGEAVPGQATVECKAAL